MMNELKKKVAESIVYIKYDLHHIFEHLLAIKHFALERDNTNILSKINEIESIINQLFDRYIQLKNILLAHEDIDIEKVTV